MTAAYQVDSQPVDRSRFYALACDPQRSVVVEACAGAGKTWMLVSRILRALLAGTQPHEILAITFTRKAAGEMRQRLDDWLREFAAPGVSDETRIQALVERGVPPAEAQALAPTLAGLQEAVLRSGRAVEVRTFHAWFSQLLRAAPLALLAELGLQPDLDLIDDLDDHRAEIFRRFHAAVLRDPGLRADHARLIAERGRSQVQRWFDEALAKRVEFELADEAGVLDDSVVPCALQWPELQGLAHPTHALAGAAWEMSLRELARALVRGGARAVEAGDGIATVLAASAPEARFDAIWPLLFTKDGKPRKQLGTLSQLAEVHDELLRIGAQVRQHDAHLEHARMVRLARVLLREFAAYKRARGLADMADLERCGLALLRDATLAGWVQERLDARIRHVLIDEFQDTSPLQWHALLAWLSAYAGAGGGASGQRPPGVFIVGDPKQSIYRFRRAEPKVFAAARDFVVGPLGGVLLACDHTRRNAPEVLDGINAVFTAAGVAGEFSGFRLHTTELPATPSAGIAMLPRVMRPPRAWAATAPEPVWRDTLTTPRHLPEEVLREREAASVALAIQAAIMTQGMAPADIFVLSRKRQSLRLVAQALRRRHLPYAAVEDDALMAAPEARDLVAVLDAIVSPQHRLALAQALRSPLFGASDDDLIALAQRAGAGAGDWWRALTAPGADAEPFSSALQRAGRLLPGWQAAARVLPPHDLLDRIVAEGELRERVAMTVPPEQRAAAQTTISAMLGLALTLDGARYATPYNFVRALKRRRLKVAAASQPEAVQLLTVHGAKGLEARLVFVMDADPEPPSPETAVLLVDWPVDAERPQRCAFVYAESACPPSLRPLLDAEILARRREELNGLYVAMSRAKAKLVFSATEPHRRTAATASWWQRIEPLATLWEPVDMLASSGVARPAPVVVMQLPAGSATEANASSIDAYTVNSDIETDKDSARLGRAVHRVLEWRTGLAAAESADLRALAEGASRELGAPPDRIRQVASAILESPACAPFFGGPALRWGGNEVPVNDGGDALRIDRLVELDTPAGPVWWVLDYKLHHTPAELPAYREQLLRYAAAVRRTVPASSSVRAAFITGAGAVIEVDVA